MVAEGDAAAVVASALPVQQQQLQQQAPLTVCVFLLTVHSRFPTTFPCADRPGGWQRWRPGLADGKRPEPGRQRRGRPAGACAGMIFPEGTLPGALVISAVVLLAPALQLSISVAISPCCNPLFPPFLLPLPPD